MNKDKDTVEMEKICEAVFGVSDTGYLISNKPLLDELNIEGQKVKVRVQRTPKGWEVIAYDKIHDEWSPITELLVNYVKARHSEQISQFKRERGMERRVLPSLRDIEKEKFEKVGEI